MRRLSWSLGAACLLAVCGVAQADQYGLKEGVVSLKSANVLAFGPDGILFVGDAQAARIYAIQTGDKPGDAADVQQNMDDVSGRIAKQLGVSKAEISDLAVNPLSGHLFASASTDKGPKIVTLDGAGAIKELDLSKIAAASFEVPNAPEDKVVGEGRRARNNRVNSVTDLAFVEGKLLVSGMAGGTSTVRSFNFPFNDKVEATALEIYHGAHGQLESYAPIRTFVPFVINGEPNVLAGFVCTPLVKFPVKAIGKAEKTRGTTVAELGNRNQPLDMISYKQGDQDYLLLANSARGVMKISTKDLDRDAGIESKVADTAGQTYDRVDEANPSWKGVVQMDRLNDKSAVVLAANGDKLDLKTLPLP